MYTIPEQVIMNLSANLSVKCRGVAWNQKISLGDEPIPDGWEQGDLAGFRIDLNDDTTADEVSQIKSVALDVIQNWETYKQRFEVSQKMVITSENASKLVKLLVEKGFMTQEEVVTALLADN